MINMENIHKSFGKLKVLKGINLDLSTHGIHAILGPNGSGKTTLMKILLGMVIPDEGSIYLNNRKVNGDWKYREDIDYVSQIARFPDNLKVRELVKMVKSFRKKKERSDELIRLFKMEQYLDHKLGELSGGSRQKVNLILAFMFDSPVVVLDEPTSGLDPVAVMVLKDLIRKERVKGKVILMSTHIMDLVEEMADQIIFLLEGKVLYTGTVEELQKMNKAVRLDEAIANLMESRYA